MIKTTYVIENGQREVVAYSKKLRDAKDVLLKINNPTYRILCIKGPYYGEGRHAYQIVCHKGQFPGAVFIKTKL